LTADFTAVLVADFTAVFDADLTAVFDADLTADLTAVFAMGCSFVEVIGRGLRDPASMQVNPGPPPRTRNFHRYKRTTAPAQPRFAEIRQPSGSFRGSVFVLFYTPGRPG
jgi:hypothetical protein